MPRNEQAFARLCAKLRRRRTNRLRKIRYDPKLCGRPALFVSSENLFGWDRYPVIRHCLKGASR